MFETIIAPGTTLSLVNVVALLAAAPITVIYKLANSNTAPFSDSDVASVTGMTAERYFGGKPQTASEGRRALVQMTPAEAGIMAKVSYVMYVVGGIIYTLAMGIEMALPRK